MTQVSFKIYHNPRCSKSRKVLEILNSKTKNFKIIKYLEDKIDIIELKSILKLNNISKDEMIRTNETSYKELKLSKKENGVDWILWRKLCDLKISSDDINHMGNGGLL